MRKVDLLLGSVLLAAMVAAAPGTARAAEAEDDVPHLWEPDQAVAFLLGTPRAGRAEGQAARTTSSAWNGSLGGGITRALFGSYQLVLSSQDLPVCGFSPSCSRFAERVIDRCGFAQGALLSLDRLLRDHPLAIAFYPRAPEGHLLKDDPERYCLTASE
jgi:putative component of membrane protein insertase Oxa1/YidC/SpoIIIJ protein YidD